MKRWLAPALLIAVGTIGYFHNGAVLFLVGGALLLLWELMLLLLSQLKPRNRR